MQEPKSKWKIVFASGTDELNERMIERMRGIYPELPLCVVSEFPPADRSLRWVRYRLDRSLRDNLARCQAAFGDSSIRLAAVMLTPGVPLPLRRLRWLALLLAPRNAMFFNEELEHFMLRPRSLPAMLRHALWRARNLVVWHLRSDRKKPEAPEIAAASQPVRVYEGRAEGERPRVLIASPYVPFPLSHGGAVRMYNLMRRAASSFDQLLIAFTEAVDPPAPELSEVCSRIVLVPRKGSHLYPRTDLPDTVQDFASENFRRALRQAVRDWRPQIAQLEFTQMAQYADDCAPARTILVEHDITFDLYNQLSAIKDDWDVRQQLPLWKKFEIASWRKMERVVTMSERDRYAVGSRAAMLPNGVDLEHFQPFAAEPEPRRVLFIGSFAHLPNLLAVEFFLREIWPRLEEARLHIIAGANHAYHLERSRVNLDLDQPGVEVEGFVADVRPAYAQAAVVIAPLRASGGTNIKILEAMAMGKAIVSTRAGVNGLDITPGNDFLLANTADEFAAAVSQLLDDARLRTELGASARRRVERDYNWDVIAQAQARLYGELINCARS